MRALLYPPTPPPFFFRLGLSLDPFLWGKSSFSVVFARGGGGGGVAEFLAVCRSKSYVLLVFWGGFFHEGNVD